MIPLVGRRERMFIARGITICFVVILLLSGTAGAEETVLPSVLSILFGEELDVLEEAPSPLLVYASNEDDPQPKDRTDTTVVLDLEEAQRYALESNPSIQAVAEQVEQAQEYVRQARSMYFPQVSASYRTSTTRMEDESGSFSDSEEGGRRAHRVHRVHDTSIPPTVNPGVIPPGFDFSNIADALNALSGAGGAMGNLFGFGGVGGFSSGQDVENSTLGVTAALLLFNGFSRRMTYSMARFGREETEAAYEDARRLLLDGVALTFYGVQLARENILIAQADKDFNSRIMREVKIRQELGKAALSDVLNFEVRQQAAEAALLMAEKDYQSARIALALVMGKPDVRLPDNLEVAPLPDERAEDMQMPDEAALIQYALEHRPDLVQRENSVERAKASTKDRYGNLAPRVSLFAAWNDQRTENGSYERQNESTTVGIDVAYDLFTGGRNISRIVEAKHAKRQAEFRRAEAEQRIISDVRGALLNLKIAQQQLVLQRTASENVKRNRDLVEREYQAGKAPLVRLNQGQRDLVEADARLVFARVNLLKAWHELRTATAETVEKFKDEK